jgi:hypothetical protein
MAIVIYPDRHTTTTPVNVDAVRRVAVTNASIDKVDTRTEPD